MKTYLDCSSRGGIWIDWSVHSWFLDSRCLGINLFPALVLQPSQYSVTRWYTFHQGPFCLRVGRVTFSYLRSQNSLLDNLMGTSKTRTKQERGEVSHASSGDPLPSAVWPPPPLARLLGCPRSYRDDKIPAWRHLLPASLQCYGLCQESWSQQLLLLSSTS